MEITKYIYSRIQDSCTVDAQQPNHNEDSNGTEYILHNYIRNSVNSVIDEAEIYAARFNKQTILNQDTTTIPIRLIPSISANPTSNTELIHVQIQNENDEVSGKFGWCFVCRRQANLYCKDTRIPLCSVDCKKRHIDDLALIDYKLKQYYMREELLNDGVVLIRTLVKLAV